MFMARARMCDFYRFTRKVDQLDIIFAECHVEDFDNVSGEQVEISVARLNKRLYDF